MIKVGPVAITALALVAIAPAQARLGLQIGGGLYRPTSALVRDAFGSQWTKISFRPGSIQMFQGARLDFDSTVIAHEAGGNRVFIFAPTIGYVQSFGDNREARPYFAARVGPAYADYRILGTTERGVLWNTNFELGVTFSNRLRVYGRYDLFSKRDGVDFSGFSVNAELTLFSF